MSPSVPGLLAVVPGPGLLFGLLLAAAIVGAYAARLVHVPRVVGFVLGGVVLRAVLTALLGESGDPETRSALSDAAEPLGAVKDLALGLILFSIGGVFERSKIRAIGARVVRIVVPVTVVVILLVFSGCALAAWLVPLGVSGSETFVLVLFLALAAVETAPAATAHVLHEYDARGTISDTLFALTGTSAALCVVLFYGAFLMLTAGGGIETSSGLAQAGLFPLLWTTLGSLALGVLLGALLAVLHAKLPLPETLLFFFALFILLGAGEQWLWKHRGVSYNFLLTALITGAVFTNVAIDPHKVELTLRTIGAPIFAGFFAMAGYAMKVESLPQIGFVGAVYVAMRFLGKHAGCRLGLRWMGQRERGDERLGVAMVSQASVAVGLVAFVSEHWASAAAAHFEAIILGALIIFELLGPLLVKRCVVQAGEVKAVTLLLRGGAETEGASIVRLTVESLLRLVGRRPTIERRKPDSLQVRHIMRTNVQLIPASATFDEVLHAIERSTYSHFPVVHTNGEFAGVIHFADVRDVIYDPSATALVTAVDLADPVTPPVPQGMALRELLEVFTRHNVGALPVVDQANNRRIVGLVEQRDLLRALHLAQDSA